MTLRSLVRATAAILALLVIGLAGPTAASAEDTGQNTQCLFAAARYDITWRPGSAEDTVTLAVRSSQVIAKDNEMRAQGWRLLQIHARPFHCPNNPTSVTYDLVWRRNYAPEHVIYGWSPAAAAAKNDELAAQGWRLTVVDAFVVDGNVYYNAAWRQSNEGQYDYFGLTYDAALSQFQQFRNWGWAVHLIDSYQLTDGSVRYNISFRPGASNVAIFQWAPQDFEWKYAQMRQAGWNTNSMSIFSGSWQTRYNVSWLPLGQYEEKSRALSQWQVLSEIASHRSRGLSIATFEAYF
jgi:hypothetical protein